MTDEITKQLKTKYKKVMSELGAEFTTDNLLTLITYDSHLNDPTITKNYHPKLHIDEDGRIREELVATAQLLVSEQQHFNQTQFNELGYFQANQTATLDSFHLTSTSRQKLFELGKNILRDTEKGKKVKGLYIYGKNRIGKTYFISCLANELSKKYTTCFLYYPDFSRSITDSISDQTLENKIKLLKNADFLIFDDFGQGRKSSWLRDSVLLPIIQHRINFDLPILFTSNFSLEELVEVLSMNDSSENSTVYSEQVAVSLVTRIKEFVIKHEFKNE